jgi:acyl-coenzyme A synthetase/AMP-(fatty) acid ligase
LNLTEPILRQALMQPQAAALIEGERTITFAALAHRVVRTAGHLASLGVGPSDYVGVCLKDDSEHVITLLALLHLGAVCVPIDWHSRPAEKARVANAFPLRLIVTTPEGDVDVAHPRVALDEAWHKAVTAAEPAVGHPQAWDAPAILLASSGSTGLPKFTLATSAQLYLHATPILQAASPTRAHRALLPLPLYYTAVRKVLLAFLLRGDSVILYPSLFTAAEFVQAATLYKATASFVPPSAIRELLAIADPGRLLLPDLDVLAIVGAPLFAEEKRETSRLLTRGLHDFYGTAPTGPVAVLRPEDMAERAASVGRPPPVIDVEVVDDAGRTLGPHAPGRLRCRGPGIASPVGAGHGPDDFRDGWYYPGEIAAMDERGYIFLQGRTSEVIFRGGAKVFPVEVEGVLQAHGAVLEAAVVGRPTSNNEHELVAFVTINRPVTSGELMAHCRTRLTAHKVPREIHIIPELPRSSSGKVDKRAL